MGTVSNAVFEEILEAVSANNSAAVVVAANKLLDAGNSPAQLARQFVRYLRNCVVAKIAGITPENDATELLQISPDERRRAARTAMLFTEEELSRFLQVMLRTFDELGYRQEQRFHFELGLLKLVHLQRLLPVEEILSGMPVGGGTARPAATPASRPAPSAPATPRTTAPAAAQTSAVATPAKPAFSPFEADRSRKMSSEPAESPRSESTVGSLALAPEPPRPIPIDSLRATATPVVEAAPAPVVEAAPAPVAEAKPVAPASLEDAQTAVCSALSAKKHNSAADELDTATWTIAENELRIQTAQTKTMLNMIFNAEATAIIKEALRASGLGTLKLVLLPQDPAQKAETKKKAPRTGSVQAKAMEHPLVQQAQKLFNAEIRNVMDLRKD
jgi:DNA polymerase-3 subunit gamma/tau